MRAAGEFVSSAPRIGVSDAARCARRMRRADALRILAEHAPSLHAEFGVTSLSVFGSVARDEARDSSDVDVLVEFASPVTLLEFIRLRERLSTLLDSPVDLSEPAALHRRLRERILSEAIRAA